MCVFESSSQSPGVHKLRYITIGSDGFNFYGGHYIEDFNDEEDGEDSSVKERVFRFHAPIFAGIYPAEGGKHMAITLGYKSVH